MNLTPSHLHTLEVESALARSLIDARGYRTVEQKAELKRLGFGTSQLLTPTLLLPIWGISGEIVGYQSRPDNPRVRDGKPVKYETPAGMKMALDVHPSVRRLVRNPQVPLFITEGIKKGDSLASRGLCAVALLGVWNWRGTNSDGGKTALTEWEDIALNGRQVYIVFDSDVMLKPSVHDALARLKAYVETKGGRVALVYLPPGPAATKQGVDDFFAAGGSVDGLLALACNELLPSVAEDADRRHEDDEDVGSQATRLIRIASTADLFHDEKGDAYAAIEIDGHRETLATRSTSFKRWLARSYYLQTGSSPKGGSISDALTVVEGKAQFEGDTRRVWTRVAEDNVGCIYLDLGSPTWEAVRIGPDGWTMVTIPPVHFVRGPATAPLSPPERGGSLDELRQVINMGGEDDLRRVVAWMVGCLRPRGPYPVLAFIAEQGSGKSATARMLRSIVDPSAVPLRGMPRDERDLVIAARANHVIALDNVSHLPQWLSDAFCRMATGGGWSTRRLYTDADEEIFTQSRPVLITGIDDFITNGDLLDRAMLVNLPTISPQMRRQEADLERRFAAIQPRILGVLLDAVSAALRNLSSINLGSLPRMADFAAWIVAAEKALGWPEGSFLDAYLAGANEAQDVVLEASLIGEPLRSLVEERGEWIGTSSQLLEVLTGRCSEDVRRSRSWPRSARSLSSAVRRIAPTLRAVGIEAGFEREKNAKRQRLIVLRQIEDSTVHTVQPSGKVDEMDDLDDLEPDFPFDGEEIAVAANSDGAEAQQVLRI